MRATLGQTLIGAFAVAILGLAAYFAADPPASPEPVAAKADEPPAAAFVVFPVLQYPTQDSIGVFWETAEPAKATVSYGPSVKDLKTVEVAAGKSVANVTLTGLSAETNYVYRVAVDGGPDSGVLQFATAAKPGTPLSFAVVGDTQANPKMTGQLAKLIYERRPNFVVHCGDVVDNGPLKNQWTDHLFGPCAQLFARAPLLPTIGNHEKNTHFYYDYFMLPDPEYYYKFSYGDVDLFAVDTNKSVKAGTEQFVWLEKALAASTAKWKFVFHHHPPYSSDNDDYGDTSKGPGGQGDKNARALVPLYDKYNVDIVWNGHVHIYERSRPIRAGKIDRAGVRYITSGGGGARLENVDPLATWFKDQVRVDYHFCLVNIEGDRLEFKVFDKDGHLFDTLDIKKGQK